MSDLTNEGTPRDLTCSNCGVGFQTRGRDRPPSTCTTCKGTMQENDSSEKSDTNREAGYAVSGDTKRPAGSGGGKPSKKPLSRFWVVVTYRPYPDDPPNAVLEMRHLIVANDEREANVSALARFGKFGAYRVRVLGPGPEIS